MTCPLRYCNDSSNCPKKAACAAEKRLLQSRAVQSQVQVSKQRKLDNSQEFTGIYVGHNVQLGLEIVRRSDGGIVQCKSISTGYLVPGQLVSGIIPYKGGHGIISGMPN